MIEIQQKMLSQCETTRVPAPGGANLGIDGKRLELIKLDNHGFQRNK